MNIAQMERVYRILIVSTAGKFTDSLIAMLPETSFKPVDQVGSIAAAQRAVSEKGYDIVIINAPLPDDMGTRLAMDLCHNSGTSALVFVKSEIYGEISSRLRLHGVFTLAKPTSSQMVMQAVDWLCASRERLRKLEKKTATVEEKMEEIRIVNRAKWLLIENLTMTENDAHKYIEKTAMDRCISRREVAESIIHTYS